MHCYVGMIVGLHNHQAGVMECNGVARIFFWGGATRYIFVTSPGADRIQWGGGGGVVAEIFRGLNYRIGFSGGGG